MTNKNSNDMHPFFMALAMLLDVLPDETVHLVGSWYDDMKKTLVAIAALISRMQNADAHEKVVLLRNLRTSLSTFTVPAQHFSRICILTAHLRTLLRSNDIRNKKIVCPVDVAAFVANEEDPVRLQYVKYRCRMDYGLRKAGRKVSDIFRRREQRGKTPQRTFDGRGFTRIFLLIPFEKVVLGEWNRFNRTSTDLLGKLNRLFDEQTPDMNGYDISSRIEIILQHYAGEKKVALDRINSLLSALCGRVREHSRIAGTALLPGKQYRSAVARKEHRRFGKQFIADREAWRRHWQGSLMDILKDVDLLHLAAQIRIIRFKVSDEVSSELGEKTEALFDRVRQAVTAMRQRGLSADISTRKGVRTFLAAERKTFSGNTADLLLTPISELVLSFDLEKLLKAFNADLRETAGLLQETYAIFITSDKKRLIPESQIVMVPLRELFLRHLDVRLDDYFEKTLETGRNNLILLSNKPVVVGEVLESTFDTAYMELRKKEESDDEAGCITRALNEFNNGIDRTLSVLDEMHEQLSITQDELERLLVETEKSLQESLNDLRRSDHLLALRLQLVKSRAAERFTRLGEGIGRLLVEGGRWIANKSNVLGRWAWKPVAARLKTFFRVTRLDADMAGPEQGNVETYLKMARGALDSLPAVYRRTFRFEPLDSEKLLVGRERELALIGEAISEWHNGRTGLIVLTGERGSGRSSVARIARNRYFTAIPVVRTIPDATVHDERELAMFITKALGLPSSEDLDSIERNLTQSEDDRILILEDVHHIFLRSITGLQVFKRFILFASRTQGTVFWFLTCGEYAWRYLDKVLGLNRYFSTIVNLKGFEAVDIEELIMRRHRLCGIPLRFQPDPAVSRSKKYRQCTNDREKQEVLQKQFFRKLTDASTGNASVAMLLWCISIRNHEHRMFEIFELPDLGIRIDTTVNTEELFVIASVVQHERMSPDDLANVLSITTENALLHLTALHNKGIFIEKNGFYELHFFLYRSFIGYLHEKRIFH